VKAAIEDDAAGKKDLGLDDKHSKIFKRIKSMFRTIDNNTMKTSLMIEIVILVLKLNQLQEGQQDSVLTSDPWRFETGSLR
jgi:hypothetical protein